MRATEMPTTDLLSELQGIIGRETRQAFKATGAAEELHASLRVETLTAVKAELKRHRALVADLQAEAAADRYARRYFARDLLAEHGFGTGA